MGSVDPSNHGGGDTEPGLHFLSGGGEMGRLIRSKDWSSTPLGPPQRWPQSLLSAVSILLPSRAQIILFWGPELVAIYNDAYRPTLGVKHPDALGQPAGVVWSELWEDVLRPLLERVLNTGETFWASDHPFFLERHGYSEETYFDVSYDPVRDESGGVGGVFCIVSETSGRVVGERRLRTLRDLGRIASEARTVDEVFLKAADVFRDNRHDLPFAALYERKADGTARCAAACGIEREPAAAWPLADAALAEVVLQGEQLRPYSPLPGGPWPEPARSAVILPIATPGRPPFGYLVAGISPRRELDEGYSDFLRLAASSLAASLTAASALEEQRSRAEALAEIDRAKTTFFSNISHEFRTPLTLMLGPLEETLREANGVLPKKAALELELVHRNGERLLKLVNTLLDFSRMEAGRIQATYEPTDLAAFTAELASTFRSVVESAGMKLVVDCPPLDQRVFVDRDMWEKIVLNLLSNAFKFTFEGTIEVTLRSRDQHAELSVRDTGVGIPPEEIPRLFERFHRVQGAKGRSYEGTGIGLALVQELTKLHGGSVLVESVPGSGSTFTVSVPFGKSHLPAGRSDAAPPQDRTATGATTFVEEALRWLPEEDIEPGGSPRSSGDGRPRLPPDEEAAAPGQSDRPRILLADDNADMRSYVRRLLAERFQVRAVADGKAALAAALESLPDLILSDVMMPGMDGLELLRRLRADPRTREVPVIFLSARAGEEARVEGLQTGADDYLIKPFSATELLARVHAHLQLAKLRRAAAQELRRADRRKDEFLATLAHELRNPLAPIRNSLEIAKQSMENRDRLRQSHDVIDRQLAHLVRIVDDLLDVSRIGSDKLELRKERVELAEVFRSAVETSRPLIDAEGLELTVSLPDQPVVLAADPVRLAQVVSNLLNNAARYSNQKGRIRLSADCEGTDVVVRVVDDGVGIAAESLPRIFDLFVQVDRSLERSRGGLGIGLTLVQRLVQLHGGTVEAHSGGPGMGSEFTVRLPAAIVQAAAASSKEARVADRPAGAPRRRVLVADDNQDSADSLAQLLRILGCEVATAYDGLEAFEAIAPFRPDIVLLDLGMPELSGYDVARRIRERWPDDPILLVALTGWGQEEDRRRTREAGFDQHLVKPVELAALEQLLVQGV